MHQVILTLHSAELQEESSLRKMINTMNDNILKTLKNLEKEVKELRKQIPIRSYNMKSMIYERAAKESVDYFYDKASDALILEDRFKVLEYTLKTCMENTLQEDALFLEFGVFQGESINFLANLAKVKIFYGFDSFEGLPETWGGKEAKGHFNLDGKLPKVKKNVELKKGWFNETLEPFLKEKKGDVAFLHIDCDLYSSTKTVLDLLAPRIKEGTVIVFDEYINYPNWQKHEFKAFQEFVKDNNVQYEYLALGILDMAIRITSIGKKA